MQTDDVRTVIGILVAAIFSLLYAGLYPMLIGGGVIYWYPYWPPVLAAAYVAGGVLLQIGLCYRRGTRVTVQSLVGQVLAGVGYLAASVVVSDGPYMS